MTEIEAIKEMELFKNSLLATELTKLAEACEIGIEAIEKLISERGADDGHE